MIRITSTDARHQYDAGGNAITTWCPRRCNWMVNKEYEKESIDWYGEDSDFPGGYTEAEYDESFPNWRNNPHIVCRWSYNTISSLVKAYGDLNYWRKYFNNWSKDILDEPYNVVRSWEYLDYTEDEAINSFKDDRFSDGLEITYNGKVIYKK